MARIRFCLLALAVTMSVSSLAHGQTFDATHLVPPPPAHGSVIEAQELAELHTIQKDRTEGRLEQAQWDQDHENWTLYAPMFSPAYDMDKLPATSKLLTQIQKANSAVANKAKTAFHRQRPWALDPTIKGCKIKASDDPYSAYPSGHTDVGYALGVVLAELMPDHAQAILDRASDYAYSRLVCGMHYRSDTVAAEALATAVTLSMLRNPDLAADLAAAKAELKAAGLTAG